MKKVPELRFPEFDGEWEEKRLGEVVSFKKGKGIPKNALSESGSKCILYGQLYTTYNEIIEDVCSYTDIDKKDLLFGKIGDVLIPSSGETALDMSLASALFVENVAVGGDINILRPKKGFINSKFLSYQINSARKIDLAKIAEGASVVHLYNSNLENINVINPVNIKEQEKISNFFTLIDKKVETQEEKIDSLKDYKKGMIQKIFNQEVSFKDENGEDYPEWEKKKLSQILKERKFYLEKDNGIPHGSLSKEGVTLKTERFDRDFLVRDSNKQYKVTHKGDICYNPANLKFGVICRNNLGTIIFSPIYVTFTVNKNFNDIFMGYYLTRPDFINRIRRYEEGTVYERMAVKPIDFLKHSDYFPTLKEQEKIAHFLSDIDVKIEKENEKLVYMKELKKGFMQKMFI